MMGTAYTGVPAHISLASPVSITVPADGDGDLALTFDVPLQALADYVEALRAGNAAPAVLNWPGAIGTPPNPVTYRLSNDFTGTTPPTGDIPGQTQRIAPLAGRIHTLTFRSPTAQTATIDATITISLTVNGTIQTGLQIVVAPHTATGPVYTVNSAAGIAVAQGDLIGVAFVVSGAAGVTGSWGNAVAACTFSLA
jgi:hypothetical protein